MGVARGSQRPLRGDVLNSNVQLFADVVARSMKDMLGARTIIGARSSLRGAEALEFWIFEAPRFVVGSKT